MSGRDDITALPLLIANRGEIALRIQHAASLFPLSLQRASANVRFVCYAVHTAAEAQEAHILAVPPSQRILLPGAGPRAYLDIAALIKVAKEHRIWGVAPGYGFLSESAEFAKAVEENGMVWVGPGCDTLDLFSNKIAAKNLAEACDVPILESTKGDSATFQDISGFASRLPPNSKMIIKAVAGGGGRGMRVIDLSNSRAEDLQKAYDTCVREAEMSFADGRVYAERFLDHARHVEVQIVGDGSGDVCHLWERECTLQRRHQKLVEIAPSPTLEGGEANPARQRILQAALRMAAKGKYRSLGTFEFLFLTSTGDFFFMEANPRIQVEHTITEQITSIDLVAIQLQIANGASLKDVGLSKECPPVPFPSRTSIQVRVNAESMSEDGTVMPTSGTLTTFDPPRGSGVRTDTCAHGPILGGKIEYRHNPAFDSLLAKVICTAPTYASAIQSACLRLAELKIAGLHSNLFIQRALLSLEEVKRNEGLHTRFFEERFSTIWKRAEMLEKEQELQETSGTSGEAERGDEKAEEAIPAGMHSVESPLAGIVVDLLVKEGDVVQTGKQVALVESMKMEHVIRTSQSGKVKSVLVSKGSPISLGDRLLMLEALDSATQEGFASESETQEEDTNVLRDDLKSVLHRKSLLKDEARTKSVARRRAAGFLTARENIDLLIDQGTFIEWGDFALAAQRTRMDEDRLLETTGGDGVITGWASVNAERFRADGSNNYHYHSSPARCALVIYDYMVLAGTQGHFHHLKLDRLFRSVIDNPAPLILYAEGGGGRPGDVDLMNLKVGGLDTPSFALLALIRSRGYPTIGLANGYTFAGNAALLGTCDIVVATEGGKTEGNGAVRGGATSTGMGGPAMIEGGGLGVVKPEDVGPVSIHEEIGDYDVVVRDERMASTIIKKLLSFFQGPVSALHWRYSKDESEMRRLLPSNRVRAYDVRRVIDVLCDDDSFIELGSKWGQSLVTGLASIEGEPVGLIASSVLSPLGGAIDASSAQKATRFVKMLHRTKAAHLCVLCDTPGFMVGPPAEKQGGLRVFAEFFESIVAFQDGNGQRDGARVFAVTLRKAYGLGAQALLGGSTLTNFFSVAWPQGEFAGMGIEGAVRLGMKKELDAVKDKEEQQQLFQSFVDVMYQRGKAENMASMGEIDTVIDPKDTRSWLVNGLRSVRPMIPTWKQSSEKGYSSRL